MDFSPIISLLEIVKGNMVIELSRDDRNDDFHNNDGIVFSSKHINPRTSPKKAKTQVMVARNGQFCMKVGPGVISRPSRIKIEEKEDGTVPSWDPWIKSPLGKANRKLLSLSDDWAINNFSQHTSCCGASSITSVSYSVDEISTFTESDETRLTTNDVKDCSTITTDFGTPSHVLNNNIQKSTTTQIVNSDSPNSLQSGISSCTRHWPPPPSPDGMICRWPVNCLESTEKTGNEANQKITSKTAKFNKSTLNPCTKSFQPMTPDSPLRTPPGHHYSYGTPTSASTYPMHPYYMPPARMAEYAYPSLYTNQHSYHSYGYPVQGQCGSHYNYNSATSARRQLFQFPKPYHQRRTYAYADGIQGSYGACNPNCFSRSHR